MSSSDLKKNAGAAAEGAGDPGEFERLLAESERTLKEGEALPSVRQVATEYRLNPLTVLKAYQQLADEGLVEKRRGLGMFVAPGASGALMTDERQRFLATDWPKVHATILRLGLSVEELLNKGITGTAPPPLPTRTEQK